MRCSYLTTTSTMSSVLVIYMLLSVWTALLKSGGAAWVSKGKRCGSFCAYEPDSSCSPLYFTGGLFGCHMARRQNDRFFSNKTA